MSYDDFVKIRASLEHRFHREFAVIPHDLERANRLLPTAIQHVQSFETGRDGEYVEGAELPQ